MSLPFRDALLSATAAVVAGHLAACTRSPDAVAAGSTTSLNPALKTAGVLRVAADPNNLPFSNAAGEGFENKLATLVAKELDLTLEYSWHAQRRGFFRETIKQGDADVTMGIPTDVDMALTTIPYYRSSYVLVYRNDDVAPSLDTASLKHKKIGVPLTAESWTPPAYAMAKRGIVDNVVGFPAYGDYGRPNPAARIVQAVADKSVDLAMVWGPVGGYFSAHANPPLGNAVVSSDPEAPDMPFAFSVSMGVRRGNTLLKQRLDAVICKRQKDIVAILNEYHVPLLPLPAKAAGKTTTGPTGGGKPCDCD